MAGVISLETILNDPRAHPFLKELYGEAIQLPVCPAPAYPLSYAHPLTTAPASHASTSRPRSSKRPALDMLPGSPAHSTPVDETSRPSSAMDTSPPKDESSDSSEGSGSSESEAEEGTTSEPDTDDSDFTVKGSKRARRSGKSAPSKAPKPSPPSPTAGQTRPSSTPATRATPAPPPLFIQDKSKWTAVSGWCNEHRINFTSARSTQQGIKVVVPTAQDHRALTRTLKEKHISFHTYTLPEERLLRVVIRGVPKELDTSEIKEALIKENLPVHEVHRMIRGRLHEPYDMVLVSLDNNERGKAVYQIKTLCHLSGITIEPPRRKGIISQCHRCQLYGHSARNCYARPRCVKCLGDHATAECERPKDRSLCTEPPACVLCGQTGHPANYRGCPKAPRSQRPRALAPPVVSATPLKPQRPSPWKVLNSQNAFPLIKSSPQSQIPSAPVPPKAPETSPPTIPATPAKTFAKAVGGNKNCSLYHRVI